MRDENMHIWFGMTALELKEFDLWLKRTSKRLDEIAIEIDENRPQGWDFV